MPTITVNIAARGTPVSGDSPSIAGHMWFDLDNGRGESDSSESFGWGPEKPGSTIGERLRSDSKNYLRKNYSRTIHISQAQYNSIYAFADKPLAHGFSSNYNALSNSCIDYVWAALHAGGLNPANYEGRLWPTSNAERVASIADIYADRLRATSADAFVNELFRHSLTLAAEFWKSHLLTNIGDYYAATWRGQSWQFDNLFAPQRYDPLVLDLDGDGVETTDLLWQQVLFDHNNDGVKTGTGWIMPGEGFLVLDRNGNGVIDNGAELFGDNTLLGNGSNATNGFHALADQDSNRDGVVNASDVNWHQLRVWRDLDHDGVSQTNELFTLAQLDIASLAVASTPNLDTLMNGNQIADLGHYTKTSGASGSMVDINFSSDNFFRQFVDHIAISAAVAQLPDLTGSGRVRDLRQAATQSDALRTTLTRYSAATSRQQQSDLLRQLLADWADTAGMAHTLQEGFSNRYRIIWQTRTDNESLMGAPMIRNIMPWEEKLRVLEAFHGRHLFEVRNGVAIASDNVAVVEGNAAQAGTITITLTSSQYQFLDQTYAALQYSVYAGLMAQTRFKSLFDMVSARVGNGCIDMDFSAIDHHFSMAIAADRNAGLEELIEFFQHATSSSDIQQWRADLMLARQLRLLTEHEKEQFLSEFGPFSNRRNDAINFILMDPQDQTSFGQNSRNLIVGNAKDNWLHGGGHHDLLDGDTGNDYLRGGKGNDIYLLRNGSGHDVIDNSFEVQEYSWEPATSGSDIIIFDDVRTTDIRCIENKSGDMILHYSDHDSVTIKAGFGDYVNEIDRFHFADDMVMSTAQLVNFHAIAAVHLSDADDLLPLSRYNDTLYAGGGNDTIDGKDGNDLLYGEDGNDQLFGSNGDDILDGGSGDDLLIGGTGRDLIITGAGADVLAFNRGHGIDTVVTAGSIAAISLGHGISYADLAFEKFQNDLILNTDTTDQIIFENWYVDAERRQIATLQVVIEGGNDYDVASAAAMHNQKITCFDFTGLVNKFDEIRTAEPDHQRWSLSSALSQYSLGGSDTNTLGGGRAYRYARHQEFLTPSGAAAPAPLAQPGITTQFPAFLSLF